MFFYPRIPGLSSRSIPMSQQNFEPPPEGFNEYLNYLAQKGISVAHPPALAPVQPDAPPVAAREFTRLGRGTGGALTQKEKVSKEITAPAKKRKALVDPEVEVSPEEPEPAKTLPVKRLKRSNPTSKVRSIYCFQS